VNDMSKGTADENIDATLGALLRRGSDAGKIFEVLSLLEDIPFLGTIVKPMVVAGGWWAEDRKPDRVFPVLVALKDKLHNTDRSQSEYVRRDEFRDLVEEALRRIADQPSDERRRWLQNIFLRTVDEPRDHTENILFLRLAEELSTNAQKLLSVLEQPVTNPSDTLEGRDNLLARRSGVPAERIKEALKELVRAGVVDEETLSYGARGQRGFAGMLSRLGSDFLTYRNGTS
jgi:hypothetical protein